MGFWVSYRREWFHWCQETGGPSFDYRIIYEHRVILKPDANLLHIKTHRMLMQFSEEWKIEETPALFRTYIHSLNWTEIAKRWQGLIIVPYQWAARLEPETFWYYGWDIASGCIWDVNAIESVELIRKALKKPRTAPNWVIK